MSHRRIFLCYGFFSAGCDDSVGAGVLAERRNRDHIKIMNCPGIPNTNICHKFLENTKKDRYREANTDHISKDTIRKLRWGLNQMELKTSHTIMDTGTA